MKKNLEKKAQAISAEDTPEVFNKRLESYNKDLDLSVESPENISGMMSDHRKEGQGEDLDRVTENQMTSYKKPGGGSVQSGVEDSILEKRLDKRDSNYPHRQDNIDDATMKPIDALAEAQDTTRREALQKKNEKGKNRPLLDKDPGSQMLDGPHHNIPARVPDSGSQLPNHSSRFTNILSSSEKGKEVLASLRDADSILFHMYYKAAQDGRELSEAEKKVEDQISEDKKNIIAQFNDEFELNFEDEEPPAEEKPTDDFIIDQLLNSEPVGGIAGEDLASPDFKNVHERELQEIDYGERLENMKKRRDPLGIENLDNPETPF